MRYAIPMLLLFAHAMALETKDVVGMWKGQSGELEGATVEIFFGQDGTMEIRMGGSYQELAYNMNGSGLWAVNGEAIDAKSTGGWIALEGFPVEALPPDTGFSPAQVQIIAGAPRKMLLTSCEEEDDCTTDTLSYVGGAKTFTLAAVGGSISIRKAAGKVDMRKASTGKVSMRVTLGNRSFDLMGRRDPLRPGP